VSDHAGHTMSLIFAVYMTSCDIQKSFVFDIAVKITGNIHSPICVQRSPR